MHIHGHAFYVLATGQPQFAGHRNAAFYCIKGKKDLDPAGTGCCIFKTNLNPIY